MLGSGCWEGTPAPFCSCTICREASKNPLSIENRMRPEFYVETDSTRILLELSPDLRIQSTRYDLPPVTDYIVSHWHFDHMFGLYELHAWIELVLEKPITIHCSEEAAAMINTQFGFIPTNVHIVKAFESFTIGDVTVTPLPVYHMFSKDEGNLPTELNNTFGYMVEGAGRKVAYLADYYRLPPETVELVNTCDTVIADGTYLFEDKYPDKHYQRATLNEKDPDHLHGDDILALTSQFDVARIYYHSITHLPEAKHNTLQSWLPEKHYVGYDGAEIK